jgi:beta-mannosidase
VHFSFSIIFCIFFLLSTFAQVEKFDLSKFQFQFKAQGDAKQCKANFPGNIHLHLHQNKQIRHPFDDANEKHLQWVDEKEWVYESKFSIPSKLFNKKNAALVFEGIDTNAEIWLNNKKVLTCNNMFLLWKVDIKQYLKRDNNEFRIIFHSNKKIADSLAKVHPLKLPGGNRVFLRKAQYHFGWDWGPTFITSGIYRPFYLSFDDGNSIHSQIIEQEFTENQEVKIHVKTTCNRIYANSLNMKFSLKDEANQMIFDTVVACSTKTTEISIKLNQPKFWWSNGLGEAHRYELISELIYNSEIQDKIVKKIGIRKAEWITQKDSLGSSFYCKLNGKPIFAKGANYIPVEFFNGVDAYEKQKKLLIAAKNMGINMLRVWGGGVYETEAFYNLCDSLGLMVWQDFMFACAMYPGDTAFFELVKKEAQYQLERLHHHPSIVLWCGNNENDEAWHHWGWQKEFGYSKADSIKIYQDYIKLFNDILPNTVKQFLPDIYYLASSPVKGWGNSKSLLMGDLHYWGVWWGLEPFEQYKNKVGRFVSEFGVQAMPSLDLLNKYLPRDSLFWLSESLQSHQKHPTGYQNIQYYLKLYFKSSQNLNDYCYLSNLSQLLAMQIAIDAHRSAKPYCMGSLFWQMNDCWPVCSWSAFDYDLNKKALGYHLNNLFSKFYVVVEKKENDLIFTIVNDSMHQVEAKLQIEVYNLTGNILHRDSVTSTLPTEKNYHNILPSFFSKIQTIDETNLYVVTKLFDQVSKQLINERTHFLAIPNQLKLPVESIEIVRYTQEELVIRSKKGLQKNVFLQHEGIQFYPNFMDILPAKTYLIKIEKENTIQFELSKLTFKTLNACLKQ